MQTTTRFVRMPTSKQMLSLGIPELPEEAFGGDLPPMQRTALVKAMGIRPQGGGGGGLKAVVAVAAAVAIPFVAPAIATSLGVSAAVSGALAGTAMAGAAGVVSSAIVGAGLGAITAAATGGNVGKSALFGALGAGMYSYANPTAGQGGVTGLFTGNAPAPAASTAVTPPGDTSVVITNTGGGYGTWNAELGQYVDPTTGNTIAGQNIAYGGNVTNADIASQLSSGAPLTAEKIALEGKLANVSANTSAAGSAGLGGTNVFYNPDAASMTPGVVTVPEGGYATQSAPTYAQAGTSTSAGLNTANAPTSGTTGGAPAAQPGVNPATGKPYTFTEALAKVPETVAAKFKDPKALADLTLRAAGQIAGTYMAPEGMTPEEKQLLEQQKQELERLRSTNQTLFQEKLDAARQLVQDANYFDPEYFGLQRARKTQQAGARLEQQALSKISPDRQNMREAVKRQTRLATARDTGTAFDTGFTAAVDAKNRATTAGLNLYPSYPTTALTYGNNLQSLYDKERDRQNQSIASTQKLFGSIVG